MLNVALTFAVWLFFMVVFHLLLFTRWRARSAVFWKATDYWWLGITVIGLWGIGAQYGQDQINQRIHALEISLDREYGAENGWMLTLTNHQVISALLEMNSRLVTLEGGSKPGQQELSRFTARLQSYTSLNMSLNNYRPYNVHQAELEKAIQLARDEEDSGKEAASEASLLVSRAIPHENELDRLKTELSTSWFHWALVYFSPFLLAAALALRITRVTAEVFVLPRQTSR